jgi:cbb3-type cytochrome oxidase maturation protein
MSSLYILVPISLVLLAVAIIGFLWAVERRQFEDLDSPAWRALLDDDAAPPKRADAPADEAPDDHAGR